jgi:hypothetical protein
MWVSDTPFDFAQGRLCPALLKLLLFLHLSVAFGFVLAWPRLSTHLGLQA